MNKKPANLPNDPSSQKPRQSTPSTPQQKKSTQRKQKYHQQNIYHVIAEQSIKQLQDKQYIENQINDFENRLKNYMSQHRGFCKISRQESRLLSNTQGYRQFKKNSNYLHHNKISIHQGKGFSFQNQKKNSKKQIKSTARVNNVTNGDKSQHEVSLGYSHDAAVNSCMEFSSMQQKGESSALQSQDNELHQQQMQSSNI